MQVSSSAALPNTITPFVGVARAVAPNAALDNPNTTLAPIEALAPAEALKNRRPDESVVYIPRFQVAKNSQVAPVDKAAVADDGLAPTSADASSGSNRAEGGVHGKGAGQSESSNAEAEKPVANDGRLQLSEAELKQVQQLAARDREVRVHEQAHAAVGGQYAGAPSYSYQRGPDGASYAVSGEVPIDVAPVAGDPEATLKKMEQVQRAALAPAEPSSQDRAVAAMAAQQMLQARAELALRRSEIGASEDAEGVRAQVVGQSDLETKNEEDELLARKQDKKENDQQTPVPGIAAYRSLIELGRQLDQASRTSPFYATA